jgi:hypothetical protein
MLKEGIFSPVQNNRFAILTILELHAEEGIFFPIQNNRFTFLNGTYTPSNLPEGGICTAVNFNMRAQQANCWGGGGGGGGCRDCTRSYLTASLLASYPTINPLSSRAQVGYSTDSLSGPYNKAV